MFVFVVIWFEDKCRCMEVFDTEHAANVFANTKNDSYVLEQAVRTAEYNHMIGCK